MVLSAIDRGSMIAPHMDTYFGSPIAATRFPDVARCPPAMKPLHHQCLATAAQSRLEYLITRASGLTDAAGREPHAQDYPPRLRGFIRCCRGRRGVWFQAGFGAGL